MIVVTGGAGHVGTNLVLSLLADGEAVRVVDLRDPSTARHRGATWFRADVRDPVAIGEALRGARTVYHLAAVISVIGPIGGLVESVNVGGTRVVAEAALAAGVAKLVHCSSVHAFDLEAQAGHVIDEGSPRSRRARLPAYDRSKAAGEDRVRDVAERGLDAVVVNPTGILGPVDEAPSRMGALMRALWRRRMPAVVAGGFDWVDVADVVAALRVAGERGRSGENYLVAGHRRSLAELADLARACSGIAVTRRTAPMWSARICAPLATTVARRTQSPLMPTREALAAIGSFPVIDSAKAARELGHSPRPIEETIASLFAYFRDRGDLADRTARMRSGGDVRTPPA
jgi:dihydroflavonol-4-reductase